MLDQFARTRLLLGEDGMRRLARSRVAVFGLGGVGGYTVEALARSGIGALDLIDPDRVSLTNLNRQILALHSTLGEYKADVAARRAADIAPDCTVRTWRVFYLPDTQEQFDLGAYDYVVDAIDTVSGKLALAVNAQAAGTRIISALGAGNKLDASRLEVADIYETSVCPLARVLRKELRRRGVQRLKVVYSREEPLRPDWDPQALREETREGAGRRDIPGSAAFVPAVAGLILAGEVVRDLSAGE